MGRARGSWWARKAKGWFLEFRLIPVLLWSYTAVALGTGLAYAETGRFDGWRFGIALALGALIQGWVTHATNEIYDWRSGTDRLGGSRALSGGSKVLNLGLLDERDLWVVFGVSTAGVVILAAWVALSLAWWLVVLVAAGFVLGLAYTVPPIATAYRPFAGEWLGGFPGVLLSGLGAYAIQTLSISVTAVLALSAHALVCCGMLMMHHYIDAPMDASSSPMKRTTVVALGPSASVAYASVLAAAAAGLYALLAIIAHPAFVVGAAVTLPAVWIHVRTRPRDLRSVTRNELRIIQLGIAAGAGTAVGLAPGMWPVLPAAVLGYLAHLAVVAPPAELARAWRRAPDAGDRRGS